MSLVDDRPRRPRVTVKFAQTLDGRIATASGDGARRISGPASLRFAHELRAEHQSILVGVETVIADNPLLTVRLVPGTSPLRIVADSTARVPVESALLNDDTPDRTLVAHTAAAPSDRIAALAARGVGLLCVPADSNGRVDLEAMLEALVQRGIETLMVEGGARITTELLRRQLVDRLVVCVAPKIVGAGVSSVGDLGIKTLDQSLTFSQLTVRQLGKDVIFDGLVSTAPHQDSSARE